MKKKTVVCIIVAVVLLIILSGTYLGIGLHYDSHFFRNTYINGIDVSGMTAEQAEAAIAAMVENYQITLKEQDGAEEIIQGSQIAYHFVSQGEAGQFLDSQNILAWLPHDLSGTQEFTMEAGTQYDAELLRQTMQGLNCFQASLVTAPADATLVQNSDGTYSVSEEIEGNQLQEDKVYELLKQAVSSSKSEVDLVAEECYSRPLVYSDDAALNKEASTRNRYVNMTVTYYLGGDVVQTLDSDQINSWLTLDENKDPAFDYATVQAYVAELAADYDTIGTWEPFHTSLGETVYVEARTYGWQINQEEETEQLYQILLTGESTERSPSYYESALTRGENDLGNTYVEIDYTNQHMWYYKDGALIVDTAIVTGDVSKGTESPEGIFCLVDKSENEILRGEGYETPVNYWMPFFGGVGIHDADSWRGSSYGGTIYQTGGSHGCINTPTANAATIYENIDIGTPIVCYKATIYQGTDSTGSADGTASSEDITVTDGTADNTAADGTADITITDGSADSTTSAEDEWADESTYWQ